MQKTKYNQGYAALTTTIITLTISLLVIGGLSFFSFKEVTINRNFVKSLEAKAAAEGGIEDAAYRILSGKQIAALETVGLGKATTTITVTTNGNSRTVRSEGMRNTDQKNLEVVIEKQSDGISFHYGVQVGYLGLEMKNQAQIIGSVYSNGPITSENNGSITGDAWVAGGTATIPNQEQSIQTNDLVVRDIQARRDGAQSFIPTITAEARKVSIFIKKIGNPADATIRILPDNGGVPDDNNSAANGNLNSSNVTTSYEWVDVTLNSNTPLIQNQKYWLILDNGSHNTTKYYVLGGNNDASYPQGTFLYSADWTAGIPIWTAPSEGPKDSVFRMYLGETTTELNNTVVGGHAHAPAIVSSTITGDAYYQTISGSAVGGVQYPGSTDPPPQNMPLSPGQIDGFKQEGDAGGVCGIIQGCNAGGDYILDGTESGTLGPIKISGNLKIKNRAQLTLTGTIHVAGELELHNNCVIQLSSSYGSNSGLIVADGIVDIDNQCDFFGSGVSPSSYLMILTTSPSVETPYAMKIQNSSSGAIFYASEGVLNLQNQADVKEAVGQKMKIENQATVTYETGLNNVNFSSGPSGGYTIQSWKEVE